MTDEFTVHPSPPINVPQLGFISEESTFVCGSLPTPDFSFLETNMSQWKPRKTSDKIRPTAETPTYTYDRRDRDYHYSNITAIHTPDHFSPQNGKPPPRLTFAQVQTYLSRFSDLEKIGSGSFSDVYKGFNQEDNKWYALKILKKPIASEIQRRKIIRELELVKGILPHPHIVGYIFGWEQDAFVHLQMELCSESLSGFLSNFQETHPDQHIPEATIWEFFTDILLGIHRLHMKRLIHRDIKPANILRNTDGMLCLADFGLVSESDDSESNDSGDARYLAAEVLREDSVTFCSDIFSFGITMFEVATLIDLPQSGALWEKLRNGNISQLKLFPDFYSEEFKLLIEAMMHPIPENRPKTTSILQHPGVLREIERRKLVFPPQYTKEIFDCPVPKRRSKSTPNALPSTAFVSPPSSFLQPKSAARKNLLGLFNAQ